MTEKSDMHPIKMCPRVIANFKKSAIGFSPREAGTIFRICPGPAHEPASCSHAR